MRSERVVLIAAFLCAGAYQAKAQSCSAGTFSGSYGSIDVLPGTAIDTTATFSVSCTGTANNTVRLCIDIDDGGASPRKLSAGSNTLVHELYSDSARTSVWGSWGSAGTAYGTSGVQFDLSLGSGGSASTSLTVYGRISASQNTAIPGSYAWTSSSPDLRYGYSTGASCPVGGSIFSQSASSTMTATLNANASLTTATLNFGSKSIGALSANVTANGTVTVKATNTTPYTISLGPGNGSGATVTNRLMTSGASTLTYSLYSNSGRTTVWGDTVGTNTVAKTGTGVGQATTVYGKVLPQTPVPGTYTDSVVVTVTF